MGVPLAHAPDLARYGVLDNLLEGCQIIGFDWAYLYVNDALCRHARKTREELIGRTMMEVYPGIEARPFFTTLRTCMDARVAARLENEFTYADGTNAWFELRIEPVPEGLFVLSVDISAHKRAEHAMQQRLERLQSLRAIDLAILGTTDFRLSLTTVLEEALKRLRIDAAAVLLVGAGGTTLETVASLGFAAGVRQMRVRIGSGAIGRAALERRTFVVAMGPDAGADITPALVAEGIESMAAVPLVARGHLDGVLVVANRGPLNADDDWLEFLEALAGQAAMAIDAGKSYEDLQRAHVELALAYETTIEGWSNALDLRDNETAHHTIRVAELTVALARAAGMSEADLVHVRRGALLHDIGKMGIPDTILLKSGKLTPDEIGLMRKHPIYAYELLSPIPYLRPALEIPYCHHERWDGTGYPRGLKAEAIPLAARLFAVVDVWDALRHGRRYHAAWPEDEARAYLGELAGAHLDPTAVDLFLKMIAAPEFHTEL